MMPRNGEVLQEAPLPGGGMLCGLCADGRRVYVAAYEHDSSKLHLLAARRAPMSEESPVAQPEQLSNRPVSRRVLRPVTPGWYQT